MAKPYFAALILTATMLVLGCGGDGGGEPQPDEIVTKSGGDHQHGLVGQELADPLSVVVIQDDMAAVGVTVNWSTAAAGGTLTPPSAVTDAGGVASTRWTLGTTTGVQTATASVAGSTGSPALFVAVATGTAAALGDVGGNGQTGVINTALAQPLIVIVTDEFGNGVAGVAVNWAATGATLSASTDVTHTNGTSEVTVTLGGTPGPVTITASTDGLQGSPVIFTATATEAAPIPMTAAVTVSDNRFSSAGNPTSNPAVDTVAVGGNVTWTWAASAGASHNITSTGTPSFNGRGTVTPPPVPDPHTVNFAAAGTYNYYCSIHGSPTSGMTGRIVVR